MNDHNRFSAAFRLELLLASVHVFQTTEMHVQVAHSGTGTHGLPGFHACRLIIPLEHGSRACGPPETLCVGLEYIRSWTTALCTVPLMHQVFSQHPFMMNHCATGHRSCAGTVVSHNVKTCPSLHLQACSVRMHSLQPFQQTARGSCMCNPIP